MHLDMLFKRFGTGPAVITSGYCAGYAELDHNIRLIARGLMRKEVRAGDRILFMKLPPNDMVSCFFATMWCGAIPGVIPSGLDAQELQSMFEVAQAKIVFCDRNFSVLLRGIDLCGCKLYQGIPNSEKENFPEECDLAQQHFMVISRSEYFWPRFAIESGKTLLRIRDQEKKETGLKRGNYVVCATGISDFSVLISGVMAPILNGAVTVISFTWSSTELIMKMLEDYRPRTILLADSQCRSLLRDVGGKALKKAFDYGNIHECFVVDALPAAFAKKWQEETGIHLHSCHSDLFHEEHNAKLKKEAGFDAQHASLR